MNLAPLLDRDVDVGGRADPAVDQLAALELDRLVDDRQRRRALDRLRDRHVRPALLAEDDALGGVEVGRRDVELAVDQAEVVGAAAFGQHPFDVVADARSRVEAGRQRLGQRDAEVHRREVADLGQGAQQLERCAAAARSPSARKPEVVGLEDLVEVEVLELGGDPLVEDLHHLVGGDPVGEHPGDEGAGAGADVDVEVVDGAVDGEQVESAQGADLVDAAGEAASAQYQGGLRRPFTRRAARRG